MEKTGRGQLYLIMVIIALGILAFVGHHFELQPQKGEGAFDFFHAGVVPGGKTK